MWKKEMRQRCIRKPWESTKQIWNQSERFLGWGLFEDPRNHCMEHCTLWIFKCVLCISHRENKVKIHNNINDNIIPQGIRHVRARGMNSQCCNFRGYGTCQKDSGVKLLRRNFIWALKYISDLDNYWRKDIQR